MEPMYQFRVISKSEELMHAYESPYKRGSTYNPATYDPAKRHARYEKTKTILGKKARTDNPYGNYKSPYYNPEKRHEYYMQHRQLKLKGGGAFTGPEEKAKKGSKGRGGSGRGSSDADRAARREASERIKELRAQMAEIRNATSSEIKTERGAVKLMIQDVRNKLKSDLEAVAQQRQKNSEEAQNERVAIKNSISNNIESIQKESKEFNKAAKKDRESAREESKAVIEEIRESKKEGVAKDIESAKEDRDSKVDPIREKNAKLRGRLDSMGKTSDPKARARLKLELARNVATIGQYNADFSESVASIKTEHSQTMREGIDGVRADLEKYIKESNDFQKETNTELRNKVANLRDTNRKEMLRISKELSSKQTGLKEYSVGLKNQSKTNIEKLQTDLQNYINEQEDARDNKLIEINKQIESLGGKPSKVTTRAEREAASAASKAKVQERYEQKTGGPKLKRATAGAKEIKNRSVGRVVKSSRKTRKK